MPLHLMLPSLGPASSKPVVSGTRANTWPSDAEGYSYEDACDDVGEAHGAVRMPHHNPSRWALDPVVNAERVEDRAGVAVADVADAHAAVGARGEELKVGLVQGCPP